MKKLRVFVSSTSQLAEERSRLDAELPRAVFDLSLFEQAGARGVSPESRCRQEIEDSDAMVGILGPDYGSLFPGRSTSIVEWEHDTAEHLGRECLDFVKNLAPGAARDPRQEAFIAHRREFRNGQWVKFYDTPGDFVATARASLEGWLVDFLRMVDKRLKPWKGSVSAASRGDGGDSWGGPDVEGDDYVQRGRRGGRRLVLRRSFAVHWRFP
jgi:hypothetical protein